MRTVAVAGSFDDLRVQGVRFLEESAKHSAPDSSTAEWQIQVPAEGSAKLSYKVRITF